MRLSPCPSLHVLVPSWLPEQQEHPLSSAPWCPSLALVLSEVILPSSHSLCPGAGSGLGVSRGCGRIPGQPVAEHRASCARPISEQDVWSHKLLSEPTVRRHQTALLPSDGIGTRLPPHIWASSGALRAAHPLNRKQLRAEGASPCFHPIPWLCSGHCAQNCSCPRPQAAGHAEQHAANGSACPDPAGKCCWMVLDIKEQAPGSRSGRERAKCLCVRVGGETPKWGNLADAVPPGSGKGVGLVLGGSGGAPRG